MAKPKMRIDLVNNKVDDEGKEPTRKEKHIWYLLLSL